MGKKTSVSDKKGEYFTKIGRLLTTYDKAFIVNGDNVGSRQLQQIRKAIRKDSVVLFGKNTLIKKAIRGLLPQHPQLEKFMPHLKGNVGFVFTTGDLKQVREELLKNKVPAAAKAGAFAQSKVTVPAGNTGLEPGQTSFFQALNIPTKINKGAIEISNEVNLIEAGAKIGPSEAALLQKLNIKPFHYGLQIKIIYDRGCTYSPEVLDLSKDDLLGFFRQGLNNIAAIGLALNRPNKASMPHIVANGFKNILAASLGSGFEIAAVKNLKSAAASAPAAAPAAAKTAAAAPAPPPKVEEPEDTFEGMGGLFD
jgi:large subunit ribosomal protein LP0